MKKIAPLTYKFTRVAVQTDRAKKENTVKSPDHVRSKPTVNVCVPISLLGS